jgi:hypothetical protein
LDDLRFSFSSEARLCLTEGPDIGTKLVAFFFGVVGGYAGILVFDRLLKLVPGAQQQTAPAA